MAVRSNIMKLALLALTTSILGACSTVPAETSFIAKEARVTKITKTQAALKALSPPSSKVTVAVYGFEDKTGQFKPTEAGQTLSRAVSQGGDEILVKALHDAGNRSWFTVIERSNLNNLLKERQIITEMRSRYLGETQVNAQALPPLLFAGVILEGGIVGFDTNTVTGGAAARYLGIGGKTDYRQNVVTVHLRAVSVKTGEVLTSVTTEKTISSVGVSANAFKFVSFNELLEIDTGITSNEPGLMALRQAIEKAVYSLVMEGADTGLWSFNDPAREAQLISDYKYERDGVRPEKMSALVQSPKVETTASMPQLGTVKQAKAQTRTVKRAATKPAPRVAKAVTRSAAVQTSAAKAPTAPSVKKAVPVRRMATRTVKKTPTTARHRILQDIQRIKTTALNVSTTSKDNSAEKTRKTVQVTPSSAARSYVSLLPNTEGNGSPSPSMSVSANP